MQRHQLPDAKLLVELRPYLEQLTKAGAPSCCRIYIPSLVEYLLKIDRKTPAGRRKDVQYFRPFDQCDKIGRFIGLWATF